MVPIIWVVSDFGRNIIQHLLSQKFALYFQNEQPCAFISTKSTSNLASISAVCINLKASHHRVFLIKSYASSICCGTPGYRPKRSIAAVFRVHRAVWVCVSSGASKNVLSSLLWDLLTLFRTNKVGISTPPSQWKYDILLLSRRKRRKARYRASLGSVFWSVF